MVELIEQMRKTAILGLLNEWEIDDCNLAEIAEGRGWGIGREARHSCRNARGIINALGLPLLKLEVTTEGIETVVNHYQHLKAENESLGVALAQRLHENFSATAERDRLADENAALQKRIVELLYDNDLMASHVAQVGEWEESAVSQMREAKARVSVLVEKAIEMEVLYDEQFALRENFERRLSNIRAVLVPASDE